MPVPESYPSKVTKANFIALATEVNTKQPVDSDLTAIAALSTTAFGRALLTLADAAAGRTALGLGTMATASQSDYDPAGMAAAAQAASQPLDSDLTAIAALTTTAYGRAFLALADGPALRAVLGTGTADATTYLRGDGAWTTPASGGAPSWPYRSGGWYGRIVTTGFSAQAVADGTLNAVMIDLRSATSLSIQKTQLNLSAGAAGAVMRMGWYEVGTDGLPGALITDLGTVSAAAGGTVTIASTYTLPGGPCWFAAVAQGGAPSLRVDSGYRATPFVGIGAINPAGASASEYAVSRTGVAGALPTTFGTASGGQAIRPYFQIS